jgi:hypothetical protein
MDNLACPLCSGSSSHYYKHKERDFLQCHTCSSVFLHPKDYLTPDTEQEHYKHHKNDPYNTGYQNFVRPVVDKILENFKPEHKGLDFGSGTGSPIVKLLEDEHYSISQYDLYFHNNVEILKQQYDYIAASEVAEHFKEPYQEFRLLKSLLKPNGKIYVMTELWKNDPDFGSWYYKNDHTHVFLYHPDAFEWIKNEFGFRDVQIDKRVVTLTF